MREYSQEQVAAWREVLSKKLSVRQTESLIKRLKVQPKTPKPVPADSEAFYFIGLEEDLSRHFGTKVQIKRKAAKGSVRIEFYSNDDLDRLLGLLKR